MEAYQRVSFAPKPQLLFAGLPGPVRDTLDAFGLLELLSDREGLDHFALDLGIALGRVAIGAGPASSRFDVRARKHPFGRKLHPNHRLIQQAKLHTRSDKRARGEGFRGGAFSEAVLRRELPFGLEHLLRDLAARESETKDERGKDRNPGQSHEELL
jgi:hypothetical protein